MPKILPIQTSFSSGEITPRFAARIDLPSYKTGVAESINFTPVRHGPMLRRAGFQYLNSLAGGYGRVIPFHIDSNQSYIAVFSDSGTLTIFDDNGLSLDDNLVTNGDFNDGLNGWTVTENIEGSATPSTSEVFLDGGEAVGSYVELKQEVTTADTADEHFLRILLTSLEGTLNVKVGTTDGGNELGDYDLTAFDGRVTFTPNQASYWVTIRIDANESANLTDVVSATTANEAAEAITFAHPYSETDILQIQYEMAPGGNVLYLTTPNFVPYKITRTLANVWSYIAVPFTGQPAEWAGTNFPQTVTFYQGRSWWGGTREQPETFFGSVSGAYEDLTITQTPTEDDAIKFTMANKGRIQWMDGFKNLLIGTASGENIVTANDGLVWAGDIRVELQSRFGSAPVQNENIGIQALYISTDYRRIRTMNYQWQENAWYSTELTFIAEHLTAGARIVEMHWAQEPENILLCILNNGKILAATYDKNLEQVGWHMHETNGRVISCAVTRNQGLSRIYFLCVRSNSSELYIEVSQEISAQESDSYVDSFITIVNDTPSDAITAAHLPNETVSVIVDGAVHPDVVLDGSGDGTLDYAGTNVTVGLKYAAKFRTLPYALGGDSNHTMGHKKHWNRIFLRMVESHAPLINGDRPPDRNPATPMDEAEPRITGDVEVRNLGWDAAGQIEVEQDLPLSCNVVGIFGEQGSEVIR